MKLLNIIWVFILLVGCERGSFLTYTSKSVFIDGDEISLLYEVSRTKFTSGFLAMHGGGKQWTDWSKLYLSKYRYDKNSMTNKTALIPYSIKIIEEKDGELEPYKQLISSDKIFNNIGVGSKNRKFVLLPEDKGLYNTHNYELIKNLGKSKKYKKFTEPIRSKYFHQYKERNLRGEVGTNFVLTNNGEYVVSFPAEVSRRDFIDFHNINIFDVKSSETSSFRFNTPESEYDSFRIIDVEFLNDLWICLFGFFDEGEFKSAIWYSDDNIEILPFNFYGKGSYDIWDIKNKYFAELELFTTNQANKDFELTIYNYKTGKKEKLNLNIGNGTKP